MSLRNENKVLSKRLDLNKSHRRPGNNQVQVELVPLYVLAQVLQCQISLANSTQTPEIKWLIGWLRRGSGRRE
jgi:hypothetical protein